MKNVRTPLAVLLAYLTIVYNLEALSFGTKNTLVLNRYVDILILVVILCSIYWRPLSKLHSYAAVSLWLIVYFAIWFTANKSEIVEINLLTTLLEVFLISVAVLLARDVASHLFTVETTLDHLVFASFRGRTISMDDAAEEIRTELVRSRRYQRSLTVLVLEPDTESIDKGMVATVEEIQTNIAKRYALGKISEVISTTARRPDLVLKEELSDRFVILCPETPAANADILRQRIQEAVKTTLGVEISAGMASFPEDALTFEELVRNASEKLG